MNLAFKIALRYFKGKSSTQAINIVSWISMGAVALSTTAMIVLFSVYNGLESYVKDMYTAFYPEVKVSPVKGKFFTIQSGKMDQLKKIQGVQNIGISIEDMAMLDGHDHQKVIRLKGVDNDWFAVNDMDAFIVAGEKRWAEQNLEVPSCIGTGIVAEMGIDVNNPYQKIQLYYPKASSSFSGLNIASALNGLAVAPFSTFQIQPELDNAYFLIPLKAAQDLFDKAGMISAIEIKLTDAKMLKPVIKELKSVLGADFEVKSRIEQNETLFMATEMEKWMIYGILTLVLVIASFNLVGGLSMLAIEKRVDIAILKTMGMRNTRIRFVFLFLGLFIAAAGAVIGLILGLIILLLQIQWGWLQMGAGFQQAYPVEMQLGDFIIVILTVLSVGLAAGAYPALKASKQDLIFRDE
jgi:lipoprotein-releasing system permease protein